MMQAQGACNENKGCLPYTADDPLRVHSAKQGDKKPLSKPELPSWVFVKEERELIFQGKKSTLECQDGRQALAVPALKNTVSMDLHVLGWFFLLLFGSGWSIACEF